VVSTVWSQPWVAKTLVVINRSHSSCSISEIVGKTSIVCIFKKVKLFAMVIYTFSRLSGSADLQRKNSSRS